MKNEEIINDTKKSLFFPYHYFIRNFAIIAHIDHGKSTLADQLMKLCGNLHHKQDLSDGPTLDSLGVEKRRGITIKAQAVRMLYQLKEQAYLLNLIDTPGHADFAYEVTRSLAACEGSLLVVDATQGVEAQTIANAQRASELGHVLIPVINKIDMAHAMPESVFFQMIETIGINLEPIFISAKSGYNVDKVLEAIVQYIPYPKADIEGELQAMLLDSWYDQYAGVILLVRVCHGQVRKNMNVMFASNQAIYTITEVGVLTPARLATEVIRAGEVGYVMANIKVLSDCTVGDTIVDARNGDYAKLVLPGFQKSTHVVFCTFFPYDSADSDKLEISMARLHINDTSFEYSQEASIIGRGLKCCFYGILHMEVTKERVEEYGLKIFATPASVAYRVQMKDNTNIWVKTALDMPSREKISIIFEPWTKLKIVTKADFMGAILQLCTTKRGREIEVQYLDNKVMLIYEMPLNEIVTDFYNRLKSCTSGYASMDYTIFDYKAGELVKLEILINGDVVPQLSLICHQDNVEYLARKTCGKIANIIRRQMFKIIIQGSCNNKIIARETVNPYRKNVLAHCSGGDVTRKRKLLEKQKRGKSKMLDKGSVHLEHKDIISIMSDNE